MCETPYCNVGSNFDIPHKLEEVDFKNDRYFYDKHRSMLTNSLLYSDKNVAPILFYSTLELFYMAVVELKKEQMKVSKGIEEENNVEHINNTTPSSTKRKRKLFSLFRK